MSYKDFVDIKIVLEKERLQLNETVKGEVFVKNNSPIKLDLENIQLSLILRRQGKGETDMVSMQDTLIKDYSSIDKGQTVSKKFEFNSGYVISYNGYNLTQNIIVKTKVDITKTSEKELRSSKLSKFKIGGYFSGVFNPDFYHEHPLLVVKDDINYNIKSAEGEIKPGLNDAIGILVIATFIAIFLAFSLRSFFDSINFIYGIIGALVIVFLIVYYYKLRPYLLIGKINYNLKNLEGNFYEVNLNIKKQTRSVQKITYQLIGEERVTYDNGSSRSTATHIFYKGPLGVIKRKSRPMIAEASLPEKTMPESMSINDFEIVWYFQLNVLTDKNQTISGKSKIILGYEI